MRPHEGGRPVRVVGIDIVPFGVPIRGFADAYASFQSSRAVLIRMQADDGTVGIGEACAWEPEFYGETLESVSTSIRNHLAPKVIGQDPLNIHRVLALVEATLAGATCAMEGIDLALFDLAAKKLKVPACVLLGGKFRERIPVASEIGIDTPEAMAANAVTVMNMGFRAVKIKGSEDIDEDVKRVKAVDHAVGGKVALRLDPNAHWTTHGTIRAMRELENCRLQYLEQPVPGVDLDGMARIRSSLKIPLMADESVWTVHDVLAIAERRAADIINIKIPKAGGLLNAKKIEAVADAVGLPCVIGTEIEPGFSLAAKIHLAASMRHLSFASEFTELSILKERILNPWPVIVDGCLTVPEGTGFGFALNEDVLKKCAITL
jgi:L-alanine-DL-glutamate epimerase-like enolase superfamily enzyme